MSLVCDFTGCIVQISLTGYKRLVAEPHIYVQSTERRFFMQEKNKMSMEGFCKCVQMDFQRMLGNRYSVNVTDVVKTNGVKLKGLIIKAPNQNICPTIYLDYFYQLYCENGEDNDNFKDIEMAIYRAYLKDRCNENVDMSWFMEWSKVKERICCKVINYNSNRELLMKIPHIHILDLAVVFYYSYYDKVMGSGTIQIYDTHLEMWGVTKEELLEVAKRNTPNLFPSVIDSMMQVVKEMMRAEGLPYDAEELSATESSMYIVSNKQKEYGAINLFNVELLRGFANMMNKCNFWILPSSLHEVLIIPDDGRTCVMELLNMVTEVNSTQVMPEEVLANSIYKFVYATGEIRLEASR